jgi:uncharacterized membrane protein
MVKSQQQTRLVTNKHHGAIEQRTIVDDDLLPSAEELSKLKQVDDTIIRWILDCTAKEQDARHEFNKERMRLAHRETGITITSLWLAFSMAFIILLLSGLFIYFEKEIAGTIFGGIGILTVIQSFLKFGRKEKQ